MLHDDVARLPAFIRANLGLEGHYGFVLPGLGRRHRPPLEPDGSADG
ncbi:hypothetical protein ABZV91_10005 [Nocardia sp. NPDC004568]